MIDTKAIRNKILDLAIRGKLTEQLPEDGTAEELYQQIQEEKQALIKSGKIKKEKPLPEIDESDIPYDIPNSWKWTRIGTTFYVEMGQSPDGSSVSMNGKGIEFHQGKIFFGDKYINDSKQRTSNPTKIAEADSVLLCVRAPVGKVNITQRRICIGRGLSAITPISTVELDYLYYYMVTCEKAFADQGTGSTFSAINGEIIRNHLCPLPPFAEQKRIVEKIEQAFSVLDIIDELQAQYADNLTVLKSKLIEAGLRGMMSEQFETDGDPNDLVIGKPKKTKRMSNNPYEIPSSWIWTSIEEVSVAVGKKEDQIFANDVKKNGKYPAISQGEQFIDGYTDEEKPIMDVPVIVFGDHTKNVKFVDFPFVICADGTKCLRIPKAEPKYVYYWMRFAATQIEDRGYARHYSLLKKYPLPLPPLAEQKRIVDRLDKLIAVCDEMR